MSSPSMRIACCGQTDVQGLQGISCEQWKTGKTPGRGFRDVLGDRRAGARLQDLGRAVPLGRDLADVAAERAGDLEAADAAREHGGRRLGDLFRVAGGVDGQAELPGLRRELVHRFEARRPPAPCRR